MTNRGDFKHWMKVRELTSMVRVLAEMGRPDLAAADTEVDVLLTWLDSVDASINHVIALIDADLKQQDQVESGDMVRDGNGEPVAVDWPRYP